MKVSISLLITLLLTACNINVSIKEKSPKIKSSTISAGSIVLSGEGLENVTSVTPTSSNLSGYSMKIESQSDSSLTLQLVHATQTALPVIAGTVLSFLISSANAQTVLNVTVEAALPSGMVIAYDGPTCPTGWSPFNAGNGRVIVGSGSGNNDKDGLALSTKVLNETGGRELASIALPASTQEATETFPAPGSVLGAPMSGRTPIFGYLPMASQDTTLGNGDNDNMPPYIVLKYCKKD